MWQESCQVTVVCGMVLAGNWNAPEAICSATISL